MSFYDILEACGKKSGVSMQTLSVELGNARNHIANAKSRGSVPSVSNAAKMLETCGFGLYVMPIDKAPKDAIQITYEDKETSKD